MEQEPPTPRRRVQLLTAASLPVRVQNWCTCRVQGTVWQPGCRGTLGNKSLLSSGFWKVQSLRKWRSEGGEAAHPRSPPA